MSATADIPLRNARGEVVAYARVDAVDAHLGEAHRWYHHASGYVVRAVGSHRGKKKRGLVYLHRAILGLADGDSRQGDHVDLNRLNNRRANLRIVTTAEQAQNKAAHGQGNGKSPYRGVCFDSARGKWAGAVQVDGKAYRGRFDTEQEAHEACVEWRKAHMPFSTN